MRKIVVFIISASLILSPCYAFADTASGSSLTIDEQLWIMNEGGIKPIQVASVDAGSVKAASTDNTPVFINGYGMPSNMNFYYFGSGNQATTFSNAYSQLPYLFQAITYSIAYSTQNLNTKIQTALTTLNTAVSNIKTGVADINSYSGQTAVNTDNIYSRLGTMNLGLNDIKTYTDGVETALSNILSAIQNQSLTIPQELIDDVDSIQSQFPWASINNYAYYLGQLEMDGSFRAPTFNPSSRSIPNMIFYWLVHMNNTLAYTGRYLISNVSTPVNYLDSDLNSVSLSKTSLWDNFRTLGVNLNDAVMRLAFVLANDDEIAARQAASANTAAAVSNVISSSGSGSAKPTDISGVADLKSSTFDSISSGVSAGTVFSQTGSGGHAWDWFTQDIADELSAPSRRSNVRSNSKSSGSHTPYLDAYYHDLEEAIGLKLPW